jgi:uncharacterized protein
MEGRVAVSEPVASYDRIAPVTSEDRIALLDALRGLALFSIAIVHFGEQYLGAMPPPGHMSYTGQHAIDKILEAFLFIFIRGKGFSLFSFLFGVSFALQMQRAERKWGRDFRPRFAWRLMVLAAIGGLHSLVYAGDILMIYALLGMPLLLFYHVRDRWLWVIAIVLLVGAPRLFAQVTVPRPDEAARRGWVRHNEDIATRHWEAAKHGPFSALVANNATEMVRPRLWFQFGPFSRGYQTFALFLLGLWAGRRRILENVTPHLARFRKAFWWTFAPGLVLPVIAFLVASAVIASGKAGGSGGDSQGGMPDLRSWGFVLGLCAYDVWNFAMTMFYVAAFVLLFQRPSPQRLLRRLVPVGRMALTSYLLQTIAGAFMFFSVGLGLLGDVGDRVTVPVGALVFVALAWVSRVWLTRFAYGPVEWIWRSTTFLRVQPFRKAA